MSVTCFCLENGEDNVMFADEISKWQLQYGS